MHRKELDPTTDCSQELTTSGDVISAGIALFGGLITVLVAVIEGMSKSASMMEKWFIDAEKEEDKATKDIEASVGIIDKNLEQHVFHYLFSPPPGSPLRPGLTNLSYGLPPGGISSSELGKIVATLRKEAKAGISQYLRPSATAKATAATAIAAATVVEEMVRVILEDGMHIHEAAALVAAQSAAGATAAAGFDTSSSISAARAVAKAIAKAVNEDVSAANALASNHAYTPEALGFKAGATAVGNGIPADVGVGAAVGAVVMATHTKIHYTNIDIVARRVKHAAKKATKAVANLTYSTPDDINAAAHSASRVAFALAHGVHGAKITRSRAERAARYTATAAVAHGASTIAPPSGVIFDAVNALVNLNAKAVTAARVFEEVGVLTPTWDDDAANVIDAVNDTDTAFQTARDGIADVTSTNLIIATAHHDANVAAHVAVET